MKKLFSALIALGLNLPVAFAEAAGIAGKTADAMIRSMLDRVPAWLALCESSFLPADMIRSLAGLILSRAERLR